MALKQFKPNTAGQRGLVLTDNSDLHKGKPFKKNIWHISSYFRFISSSKRNYLVLLKKKPKGRIKNKA